MLLATTARNFSSLIWPDGSAFAAVASLLFDPLEPQSLEKHSESRLSYLFAHLRLLSSHSFSSLIFSLLGFSSLTLPASAFPSVHIVGGLTSKLPSIIDYCIFSSDQHRVRKLLKVLSLARSHQAWRHALSTVTSLENAKHIQSDLKNETMSTIMNVGHACDTF